MNSAKLQTSHSGDSISSAHTYSYTKGKDYFNQDHTFVPPTTINATFKDIFSEVHKNITTFFYNEYKKNEVAFAVYDKNKSSTFNGNVVGSLASGFVGAITQSTWAGIFTSISYGYANNYYDKI